MDRPMMPVHGQAPATISVEAQQVLRTIRIEGDGSPETPEEWAQLRADWYSLAEPGLRQVDAAYDYRAERRSLGGVEAVVYQDRQASDDWRSCLVYLHGGMYCFYSAENSRTSSVPVAAASGLPVVSIDYRLAPEHPFPAALDDALAAYRALLDLVPAERIGLYGDSAGGALALACLLRATEEGLPLPAALALLSPWSDLTKTGDSYAVLEGYDAALHYELNLAHSVQAYAGDHDPRHPLLSPVYADYGPTFPPTLIQVGTRDLFLSNCARLQHRLEAGGVAVKVSLWEGMWHGFYGDPALPEARAALAEVAAFLTAHLSRRAVRGGL
jgi:acetyl esterase/lipase